MRRILGKIMAMRRLQISHVTEYRFPARVWLRPHRLLLRPRENHHVRIESSSLDIAPRTSVQWKRDMLDNSVALVTPVEPSDLLRIASRVVIQHYDENPFDFLLDDYAVMYPFAYVEEDRIQLAPFLRAVYPQDHVMVRHWLRTLELQGSMQTLTLLGRLNRGIAEGFTYRIREESGVQRPAQTLERHSGSCRDFAALLMEACRHLGLASRFVSGYLFTSGTGNASTHAWAEVYIPGAGWKEFDPTSGEVAGDRHIAVAVARHPEAVPPVSGDYLGSADQRPLLRVEVSVGELPPQE